MKRIEIRDGKLIERPEEEIFQQLVEAFHESLPEGTVLLSEGMCDETGVIWSNTPSQN